MKIKLPIRPEAQSGAFMDFRSGLKRLARGRAARVWVPAVAAAAWLCAGCAQSSLIAKDDPQHAQSLKRFATFLDTVGAAAPGDGLVPEGGARSGGLRLVQGAQPSGSQNPVNRDASNPGNLSVTEEKAALIQAEAFYQYRLEFRRPSARSFLAQILATAIEFAPLSIWASSADITQLRLQSYNGSIQLYEGFLERFPASRYRSLALCRLAWAYRNASIEGLPHDAETILPLLAADTLAPAPRSATFARELQAIPYKSQDAVAAWSILPGAPQFYVGKFAVGGMYFGLAVGFTAAALIPPAYMIEERKFNLAATLISFLGFVGLEVAYSDSFEDGQKAAVRFNERREEEFAAKHPELP